MKEAIGKSLRSEEDIVSTCLLYVENPASTCLPSTDPKKLFQLSEKDGYHDSPTVVNCGQILENVILSTKNWGQEFEFWTFKVYFRVLR